MKMMLKIAVMLLLAMVTLVHGQCRVKPHIHDFDYTKVVGTWYWHFHIENEFEKDVGCMKEDYNAADESGKINFTTYFYDKKEGKTGQISGILIATDSGVEHKAPDAPEWETTYTVIRTDYKNYLIATGCLGDVDTATILLWVGFREPKPDEKTLEEVKEALKKEHIDFSSLNEYEHPDKC